MGQGSSTPPDQKPISDSNKEPISKDPSEDILTHPSSNITETPIKEDHPSLVPEILPISTIQKDSDLKESDSSKNPETGTKLSSFPSTEISPVPYLKKEFVFPILELKTKSIEPTLFYNHTFRIDNHKQMDIHLPKFHEASDEKPVLVCLVIYDQTEVFDRIVVGSF